MPKPVVGKEPTPEQKRLIQLGRGKDTAAHRADPCSACPDPYGCVYSPRLAGPEFHCSNPDEPHYRCRNPHLNTPVVH